MEKFATHLFPRFPLTHLHTWHISKLISTPTTCVQPTDSNNNTSDYWQQPIDDDLLTISEDIPYLRQSTRNLRFHHPVDAVALKATSGISVKKSLQVDERKTITAIMDEIKNMLDYKVGQ